MHVTSSVFINDDERGLHADGRKLLAFFQGIARNPQWPGRASPHEPTSRYRHNLTGEDNGDAHLKRQVMGREVVVVVTDGELDDSAELVEVFGPGSRSLGPAIRLASESRRPALADKEP